MQSLPLYEGVDWNLAQSEICKRVRRSPSLRGSGLKSYCNKEILVFSRSPSLRGSGLKSPRDAPALYEILRLPLYEGVDWNQLVEYRQQKTEVSLFTREWIEIIHIFVPFLPVLRLPLYEGVDWNVDVIDKKEKDSGSPSLRGSGLKYHRRTWRCNWRIVSLFTREWIEINCFPWIVCRQTSPSLRGSGLKLK